MTQLPIFVINLDRRPDRWASISTNLNRIGLVASRISAIDKKFLHDDPATCWIGRGHVACARSHYKALTAFLETRFPACLILEDDVEVGEAVLMLLESTDWWPDAHGLVKIESTFTPGDRVWLGPSVGYSPDGRMLQPIMLSHLGAYGYMIDRRTAKQVIKLAPEVPLPIDHLLFNLSNSALARNARPLQMVPGIVRHPCRTLFGSDLGTSRIGGRKLWKKKRMVRARYKLGWLWAVVTGRARPSDVGYYAPKFQCCRQDIMGDGTKLE